MITILSITALLLAGIILLIKIRSLFTSTIRSLNYIRKYFYVINDDGFIAEFSRLRGYILTLRNFKAIIAAAYFLSLPAVFYTYFRHSSIVQPAMFVAYGLLVFVVLLNVADRLLYRYLTTMFDNIFSGHPSKYAPSM